VKPFLSLMVCGVLLSFSVSVQTFCQDTAKPAARASSSSQREKERQLRVALQEIRDALDHYRGMFDRAKIQAAVGSHGYPLDLQTLVNGVESQGKTIHFLRKIPVDPMTGTTDWGLREGPTGGVFDVYSKSQGKALDGTKYKDW
jgi:general secretion pathway protein G